MNELQVIEEDQGIPAKLDVAKRALAEATTDWERVDIRDYARAVAAATAVLKRKNIQVQAANLVQDAERAIAKANPPLTQKQYGSIGGKKAGNHRPFRGEHGSTTPNPLVSRNAIKHMRQAHSHFTDQEFEEIKKESIETGQPLSQSELKRRAAEKRKAKKREENREQRNLLIENPPELPQGQYRTIVIDPPWPMEKIEREVRPNQAGFDYPTMSIEKISAMNIPVADNAFVFLWTTQKFLPSAFQILHAWELKYRFTMVWHKNGGIQPYNCAQFNCEFVLVGSKGNPIFADLKAFKTAFNAPRQEHSVKPDAFYELVNRVALAPRLDMFSRREIEGFDVWGNEVVSNV